MYSAQFIQLISHAYAQDTSQEPHPRPQFSDAKQQRPPPTQMDATPDEVRHTEGRHTLPALGRALKARRLQTQGHTSRNTRPALHTRAYKFSKSQDLIDSLCRSTLQSI